MEYKTYWSVADLPTNSIKSEDVVLYIALAGLALWILIKKFKKQDENYEKLILLWSTGILALSSIAMFFYLKFFTLDSTNQRIQTLLKSSKVEVIEGRISNFKSVRPLSHKGIVTFESFKIDTVDFNYSDEALGRFNRFSKTNNDIFSDGLEVRITYGKKNHEILKVEVAE